MATSLAGLITIPYPWVYSSRCAASCPRRASSSRWRGHRELGEAAVEHVAIDVDVGQAVVGAQLLDVGIGGPNDARVPEPHVGHRLLVGSDVLGGEVSVAGNW